MKMRQLNVGCFGGGTGLPSLLGGLKNNPWLRLNAVVTMFDSGGSSGQLRDELGVLPPGDVLKCALALARNEAEARRVLLSRVPSIDPASAGTRHRYADLALGTPRLAGHTGGNLLLSMMEQYSGDFLSAVDGLRSLLGCTGHVWPVSVERASVCAEYSNGVQTRGEVEVDRGQSSGQFVKRIWLEPPAQIHPAVDAAIRTFDAVLIGPGSFYTSLMPIFLVEGVRDALQDVRGPGDPDFESPDRRQRHEWIYRRRRRAPNQRRHRPARGRRHPQRGGAVGGRPRAICRRRKASARARQPSCRHRAHRRRFLAG